jgi:hypothetical protein
MCSGVTAVDLWGKTQDYQLTHSTLNSLLNMYSVLVYGSSTNKVTYSGNIRHNKTVQFFIFETQSQFLQKVSYMKTNETSGFMQLGKSDLSRKLHDISTEENRGKKAN